jgi:hypothetical protein
MISLLDKMSGRFNIGLWEGYINNISCGLLQKLKDDSSNYDFDSQILPVLNYAINHTEKIKMAHDSFRSAVTGLEERMLKIIGTSLRVEIVFYLGLCNGAGWATKNNGENIVLLGVEKIVELDWYNAQTMSALVYHELGHIWHDKDVGQLYGEGIAMYFEQLMLDDFSYYHQAKGGWLEWCHANKRELNAEYLRRLQNNESTQDFFGDWCSYKGYSDVGYFIGCEFVKQLAKKYSPDELVSLDAPTLYSEFERYAT